MRSWTNWVPAICVGFFSLAVMLAEGPVVARVAFTVLQPGAGDKPVPFTLTQTSQPKPGSRLQVWISAEEACTALLAGFNRTGQLAWPGEPVLMTIPPHIEQQIPEGGAWKWESPGEVTELDALFIDNASAELPHLKQLVDAMRGPAAAGVRNRQITELRRLIDTMTQRTASAAEYSLKKEPVSLAGLIRGMGCDWCKDAQKVTVPRAGSYLVRQRFL